MEDERVRDYWFCPDCHVVNVPTATLCCVCGEDTKPRNDGREAWITVRLRIHRRVLWGIKEEDDLDREVKMAQQAERARAFGGKFEVVEEDREN